jgi:acyl-CoA synthetase (AMP-forming)/AMP-acid ligase II
MTISMPTSPQGVICFYAANKLGVVASMIHPLSTPAKSLLPERQQEPRRSLAGFVSGEF